MDFNDLFIFYNKNNGNPENYMFSVYYEGFPVDIYQDNYSCDDWVPMIVKYRGFFDENKQYPITAKGFDDIIPMIRSSLKETFDIEYFRNTKPMNMHLSEEDAHSMTERMIEKYRIRYLETEDYRLLEAIGNLEKRL